MNRSLFLFIVVALSVIPAARADEQQAVADVTLSTTVAVAAPVDTVQKISDVKKIYVAPLGTVEGSERVRQKIINRLIKSGIVTVTEVPDHADATLTGTTEVNQRQSLRGSMSLYGGYGGGSLRGRTRYSAESVVRLIGKNNDVLWTDEVSTSKWLFASRSVQGASSNVADKLVKRLLDAIAPAEIAIKKPSSSQH